MKNWMPAADEEFGEDPMPTLAATVLSIIGNLPRDGDTVRFNRSTAKDIMNAFGTLLESVAATAKEFDKRKARKDLDFLASSLWAIDELLHVPAIKAAITNSSLFSLGASTTSRALHSRTA